MTDRVTSLERIQNEARQLFKKKNQDYGDAFANYGPIGVLVRIGDKISRLQSITTSKISLINTESLRDTLIDLHNYSAMAIMLIDEKKPLYSKKYTNTTPISSPKQSTDSDRLDEPIFMRKKSNSEPNLTSKSGNISIFKPVSNQALE